MEKENQNGFISLVILLLLATIAILVFIQPNYERIVLFFHGISPNISLDMIFLSEDKGRICYGNGSLSPICQTINEGGSDIVLGDFNEDERQDIIIANFLKGHRLCLNLEQNLECTDILPPESFDEEDLRGHIAVTDINEDQHLDLIFANNKHPNMICLGDGNANFSCSNLSQDIGESYHVALDDIDQDGNIDAVFSTVGFQNQLCFGDGIGKFNCKEIEFLEETCLSYNVLGKCIDEDLWVTLETDLGDINGDTFIDIVNVYTQAVSCLNFKEEFHCSLILSKSADRFNFGRTNDVRLGDFNKDGHLDAVFARLPDEDEDAKKVTRYTRRWPGYNKICLGDSTGAFSCNDISKVANDSHGLDIGDLNGDGNLDVVFANRYKRMKLVDLDDNNQVCFGKGNGTFHCISMWRDSQAVVIGELGDPTPPK